MIPIRDNIPSKTSPIVTVILIAANSAAFLYQLSLGSGVQEFIMRFGLVPVKFLHLFDRGGNPLLAFIPFFTCMFLHGGWFHIIGNMWYLWIFGDNVEDRVGHIKFLLFYILCGIAAGFVHVFANPNSGIPTVGASGAIAGVMGAYFLLYPRARIWTLVPIFIFVQFFEIPAVILLGFWFLMQFLIGSFAMSLGTSQGGVAWWAHIGGFVAGAILSLIFRKRKYLPRQYPDQRLPW